MNASHPLFPIIALGMAQKAFRGPAFDYQVRFTKKTEDPAAERLAQRSPPDRRGKKLQVRLQQAVVNND